VKQCGWPLGCHVQLFGDDLCSPHREVVLSYGHAAIPDPSHMAALHWRSCTVCGVRHGPAATGLAETAVLVWVEDRPDYVQERRP
jgi:hypothetical protein